MTRALAAATAAIIVCAACSKLENPSSASGELARDTVNSVMPGPGVERRLTVGKKTKPKTASSLISEGLLPPGARVSSYMEGLADDTINITAPEPLGEVERFFAASLSGKGYTPEAVMSADSGFYGKWKRGGEWAAVYAFRDGDATRAAVVISKEDG